MKRILLPVLVIGVLLLGACGGAPPAEAPPAEQPAPPEELEIPLNYTTFSDEAGLFSISYPADWEPALSKIPDAAAAVQDVITSIDSDIPMENTRVIFLAGLPIEAGYAPDVKIVVESMPGVVWTHDKVVEAKITKIKQIFPDYDELSQVKTTVDGREATILDFRTKLDCMYICSKSRISGSIGPNGTIKTLHFAIVSTYKPITHRRTPTHTVYVSRG